MNYTSILDDYLKDDETILWHGKSHQLKYFKKMMPFFIGLAIILSLFAYLTMDLQPDAWLYAGAAFLIMGGFSFLNMKDKFKNTHNFITNRRIIIAECNKNNHPKLVLTYDASQMLFLKADYKNGCVYFSERIQKNISRNDMESKKIIPVGIEYVDKPDEVYNLLQRWYMDNNRDKLQKLSSDFKKSKTIHHPDSGVSIQVPLYWDVLYYNHKRRFKRANIDPIYFQHTKPVNENSTWNTICLKVGKNTFYMQFQPGYKLKLRKIKPGLFNRFFQMVGLFKMNLKHGITFNEFEGSMYELKPGVTNRKLTKNWILHYHKGQVTATANLETLLPEDLRMFDVLLQTLKVD